MKTLQIGLDWYPERAGGLQRYYYDLINAAPPFFDVKGLVLGSENVARSTDGRIEAFAAPSDSLARRALGLRASVRREMAAGPFDLTAAHFALFAFPALDLIRSPLLIHFQGPWAAESGAEGQGRLATQAKYLVERAVFRSAQGFMVLSSAFRDILIRDYRVAPERIHVLAAGVDVARFDIAMSRRAAREQLGWPTDRPILLSVRRLVQRMGLDTLIEAMGPITRAQPDVLLLIAGRGPMAGELEARIAAAGLQRNVRLLGFVPDADLPLAYRAADLSVTPTRSLEGFGLIVLESLAAGTPSVVTPIGGLPEVAGPLDPTLVCESAESAALADRISWLLASGQVPDAKACRDYAAGFDLPIVAQRVAGIYAKVAEA